MLPEIFRLPTRLGLRSHRGLTAEDLANPGLADQLNWKVTKCA